MRDLQNISGPSSGGFDPYSLYTDIDKYLYMEVFRAALIGVRVGEGVHHIRESLKRQLA